MVEVDESCLGDKRIKGKLAVVRMLKLLASVSSNAEARFIQRSIPIMPERPCKPLYAGRVEPDSIFHSDAWCGYTGLVDLGYKKHYRVHHGNDQFVNGKRHINGIESFWSFAKRRLMKFHGIPQATFYLHRKECEPRFSHDLRQSLRFGCMNRSKFTGKEV